MKYLYDKYSDIFVLSFRKREYLMIFEFLKKMRAKYALRNRHLFNSRAQTTLHT